MSEGTIGNDSPWIEGSILLADFPVCGYELLPEHVTTLETLLQQGSALSSDFRIEAIIGRASQTGSDAVNDTISLLRAESVLRYLAERTERIALPIQALGDADRIFDPAGRRESALNRSVEIRYYMLLSTASPIQPSDLPDPPRATLGRADPSAYRTRQWEVRILASVSGSPFKPPIGGLYLEGEIRQALYPSTVWELRYAGFGPTIGVALPGVSENAGWHSFTTKERNGIDDFHHTGCNFEVFSLGSPPVVVDENVYRWGWTFSELNFMWLQRPFDSVRIGESSEDIGVSGAATKGECWIAGRAPSPTISK
jgi:hypothetical protein